MKKFVKSLAVVLVAISTVGCCSEKQCGEVCSKEEAVYEVIMTRRSIRDYKEEPVCREQMAKILEAGIYAPSAINMQPWAVRVVDNKEFIDGVTAIAVASNPKIAEQPGFRNLFRNAPTVAFIACPEESYSGEYDCGLLSQNMMLSAWSMGIGSCCLGSVVPVMNMEEAKPYMERLQLPEGYKLLVGIAFGYPAQDAPAAPERDASKAFYVE
ncbi:MAG: nitroreductase [Alistipes sp.]|nr:nitroreductase [Alistipes sp.]